jgi:hypothetical protein
MEALAQAHGRFSEWVVNGGFEIGDPPASWSPINAVLSSVDDPRPGSVGTKSMRLVTTVGETTGSALYDTNYPLEAGKYYQLSFWGKAVSGYALNTIYGAGWVNQWGPSNAVSALTWNGFSYIFLCTESGVAHLVLNVIGAGGEAVFDDVSIREVLA